MGIFDLFKKKDHDLNDDEKEQLDSIMENKDTPRYETNFDDIINYIASLKNMHEVNTIRNLLDAKEREIDTPQNSNETNFEIEEVDEIPQIEEKINFSKQKTEEKKPEFEIEEVENIPKEEEKSETIEVKEDISKKAEPIVKELKKIFGDKNIFTTSKKDAELDILKDKEIFHIGIRDEKGFSDEVSLKEQNSWFVSNIKKLSNLREFKMIRSQEGLKDLMLDRGDTAIVISFRATSLLEDSKSFNFDF